jgi:hypothetical protein
MDETHHVTTGGLLDAEATTAPVMGSNRLLATAGFRRPTTTVEDGIASLQSDRDQDRHGRLLTQLLQRAKERGQSRDPLARAAHSVALS